jgi:predicted nucleic acid-binding protein
MKAFVVDTSALVRLYVLDGPESRVPVAAVDAAGRGEARLLAPELLWAEIAGTRACDPQGCGQCASQRRFACSSTSQGSAEA